MRFSAGQSGGSPRIHAGEERFSAPEKAINYYECALALGSKMRASAPMDTDISSSRSTRRSKKASGEPEGPPLLSVVPA